jgi:hypothetical protein
MVRTLTWNCRRRGIEKSISSPGIAILFEHSEWFQQLFAELDRRGISYDRLLAAELSYDPRAHTFQYALVVNRMSPSAYRLGLGQLWQWLDEGRNRCRW